MAHAPQFDPGTNDRSGSEEPPLVPRSSSERVPLSLSQQKMWDLSRRFGVTHRQRTCITAARISGPLEIPSLLNSLAEVLKRHESLRTMIVESDRGAVQEICSATEPKLEIIDVGRSGPGEIENQAKRWTDEFVNRTFDVGSEPMFASRLIRLSAHQHVLVLAMDHMISDGLSVNILARDIWAYYFHFTTRLPVALPELPVQFPDYAIWQRRASPWWVKTHGAYWDERLANASRLRFPVDAKPDGAAPYTCATASVHFGPQLCSDLRDLSSRERTTLAMSLLAAYAATILRWQDKRELVIRMTTHGRDRLELINVIGYLASTLYLRIELKASDSFLDFVRRITQEFHTAYEHYALGYIPLGPDRADFARLPCFNWLPKAVASIWEPPGLSSDAVAGKEDIKIDPFPFTQIAIGPQRSGLVGDLVVHDPMLILSERGEGVSCSLMYMSNHFKSTTMKALLRNFHAISEEFLKLPHGRVTARQYRSFEA